MKQLILTVLLTSSLLCQAQTLQQTGGIYYAYPQPTGVVSEVPDGYIPVYISHYGRHGSRWITDDYRYTDVLDCFDDTTNLTPLGKEVRQRLCIICEDAIGRSGSLSPIGERQHHDIGARMIEAYPEIFADTAYVEAVSSTSLRCAMSMSYFTEALKEANPSLRVSRSAHNGDMDYIAYTSPEGKKHSANDAEWRKDYVEYVRTKVHPERLIASLFIDPSAMDADAQLQLFAGLYWIASDMQDVELDMDMYDIFTYDELRNAWECVNARMYICNGDSPIAEGKMRHCADHLLTDFITKADTALAGNGTAANLRFGHDTHLLRLLALMGIEGATGTEPNIEKISDIWRDYTLSPMAANLQMIFYRNDGGDVKVRILLNEEPTTVLCSADAHGLYDWAALRAYLTQRLKK